MSAETKVIAVTGASRGIGAAIALELARRDFVVGCLSRSGKVPEHEGMPPYAGRLIGVACDVTQEDSVRSALKSVAGRRGVLHGLVNNAGMHLAMPSHEMDTATFEKVMTVNATSVFVGCREAYPYLVKGGGGLIVNIGSYIDRLGLKRATAYCSSKAAVGAITRCLAVEWAGKGIRVLDVAPGYIMTDMTRDAMKQGPLAGFLEQRIPTGRIGEVSDVAKLVAALFSADIAFLSGETIYVDGAQGVNL